ncbi:MAG TPA: hypothetical protein VNO30_32290 [Kofleriaceae bacterium]|nr:hypothetical protein [Kofleriaceae bacterium]
MADQERWLETARDWVHAVERAYVAAAFGPAAAAGAAGGAAAELAAVAAAAAGAVASRFLAVGTPRSIGLVGDPAACALSLAAHRVWFQPADIRWAGDTDHAVSLGGRAVSQGEALAADIVCIHAPLSLEAAQLRRGTHVNALATVSLDAELQALAMIVDEPAGLPALAAGLRDGRQLDELTVFVGGDLAIARRALAAYAT